LSTRATTVSPTNHAQPGKLISVRKCFCPNRRHDIRGIYRLGAAGLDSVTIPNFKSPELLGVNSRRTRKQLARSKSGPLALGIRDTGGNIWPPAPRADNRAFHTARPCKLLLAQPRTPATGTSPTIINVSALRAIYDGITSAFPKDQRRNWCRQAKRIRHRHVDPAHSRADDSRQIRASSHLFSGGIVRVDRSGGAT